MGLPLEKIHMETFAFHELKKSTDVQACSIRTSCSLKQNLVQIKPINSLQQILQ